MDILHNPIADMYGPTFLLFYAITIVLTLIICWAISRSRDRTASLPRLLIPSQLNPYEVAYLRGGETEVARSVVFNLIQHGCLQVTPGEVKGTAQRIEWVPTHPYVDRLSQIERAVFDWFSLPRTAQGVFKASTLPEQLKAYCAIYEKYLNNEQLLTTPEMKRVSWLIWLGGAFIIASLGTYKLLVAIANGHSNVEYLIIMGVVALYILLRVSRVPRLSARGQAYLKQLQLAFGSLKQQVAKGADGATDITYMQVVGLFGVEMLAGTRYSYFQEMFKSVTSNSSGGCGGGCGGGGGGCGGCGHG
jgi:uncharacterized protein (TIGR04222 family)